MHAVSKDDAGDEKKKRKRTIKVDGPSEGPSGDSKVDVKRIRSDKQVHICTHTIQSNGWGTFIR